MAAWEFGSAARWRRERRRPARLTSNADGGEGIFTCSRDRALDQGMTTSICSIASRNRVRDALDAVFFLSFGQARCFASGATGFGEVSRLPGVHVSGSLCMLW